MRDTLADAVVSIVLTSHFTDAEVARTADAVRRLGGKVRGVRIIVSGGLEMTLVADGAARCVRVAEGRCGLACGGDAARPRRRRARHAARRSRRVRRRRRAGRVERSHSRRAARLSSRCLKRRRCCSKPSSARPSRARSSSIRMRSRACRNCSQRSGAQRRCQLIADPHTIEAAGRRTQAVLHGRGHRGERADRARRSAASQATRGNGAQRR